MGFSNIRLSFMADLINISSGPSLVAMDTYGQADYLRLRNNLLEVIEELKLRRANDTENEERVKQVVQEKYELDRRCDDEVTKVTALEEKHQKELQDIHHLYEDKLRALKEQTGRQLATESCSEKEVKCLKDEVRNLQLCKYDLEKRLRDQGRRLQLQATASDEHLAQMASLEEKYRVVSGHSEHLLQSQDRLQRNSQAAIQLNRTLMYVNEHQKCLVEQYKADMSSLQQQLVDVQVKVRSDPVQTSQNQLKLEDRIEELQEKLQKNHAEMENLEKKLMYNESKCQRSSQSLSDAHKLLEKQAVIATFKETEIAKLRNQKTDVSESLDNLQMSYNAVSKQLDVEMLTGSETAAEWKKQKTLLTDELELMKADMEVMQKGKAELEELNSSWAEHNLALTVELREAKAILEVPKSDACLQIELDVKDTETQTSFISNEASAQTEVFVNDSFTQTTTNATNSFTQTTTNATNSFTQTTTNATNSLTQTNIPTVERDCQICIVPEIAHDQSDNLLPVTSHSIGEAMVSSCLNAFTQTDMVSSESKYVQASCPVSERMLEANNSQARKRNMPLSHSEPIPSSTSETKNRCSENLIANTESVKINRFVVSKVPDNEISGSPVVPMLRKSLKDFQNLAVKSIGEVEKGKLEEDITTFPSQVQKKSELQVDTPNVYISNVGSVPASCPADVQNVPAVSAMDLASEVRRSIAPPLLSMNSCPAVRSVRMKRSSMEVVQASQRPDSSPTPVVESDLSPYSRYSARLKELRGEMSSRTMPGTGQVSTNNQRNVAVKAAHTPLTFEMTGQRETTAAKFPKLSLKLKTGSFTDIEVPPCSTYQQQQLIAPGFLSGLCTTLTLPNEVSETHGKGILRGTSQKRGRTEKNVWFSEDTTSCTEDEFQNLSSVSGDQSLFSDGEEDAIELGTQVDQIQKRLQSDQTPGKRRKLDND